MRAVLIICFTSLCSLYGTHDRSNAGELQSIQKEFNSDQPIYHTAELYSKNYFIDQMYESMVGPREFQRFNFIENQKPELIYFTSAKVEIISAQGDQKFTPEYLCHGHLGFPPQAHRGKAREKILGPVTEKNRRIFSFVQGGTDIKFPDGFGYPIISNELVQYHTQILNSNNNEPINIKVKASFNYVKQSEINHPIKALYRLRTFGLRVPVVKPNQDTVSSESISQKSDGSKDERAINKYISVDEKRIKKNDKGFHDSTFWYVPPGRHTFRDTIEGGLRIQEDTTAHYIAVHLHAYGESAAIQDLTTGKTIFEARSKNYTDRIGIEKTEYYSSQQGVPLYKDHDYELRTTYNNTTDNEIGAMAMFYIYALNKNFEPDKIDIIKESKLQHNGSIEIDIGNRKGSH